MATFKVIVFGQNPSTSYCKCSSVFHTVFAGIKSSGLVEMFDLIYFYLRSNLLKMPKKSF